MSTQRKSLWSGFFAGIAVSAFTNIATSLELDGTLWVRLFAMLGFLLSAWLLMIAASHCETAEADSLGDTQESNRLFQRGGRKHMILGFGLLVIASVFLTLSVVIRRQNIPTHPADRLHAQDSLVKP